MLAKHTTVESANLFRHKCCICQNVLTTTTKKWRIMKFIFVKFVILDSKNFEIIRYISFSIDFYEQETKRVCIWMHLYCYFWSLSVRATSVSKYSTVAFDFVQFPVWMPINDKLIKIKAKGIYQRFPFCTSPIKCVRNIYKR